MSTNILPLRLVSIAGNTSFDSCPCSRINAGVTTPNENNIMPRISINLLKSSIVWVSLLFLFSQLPLHAQIVYSGGTYTETFDGLPANSTSSIETVTINNNLASSGTLGWYSSTGAGSNARASSGGESGSATLYSWGSLGSSDRAYGIHASTGFASTQYFGVQIQNTTGATINSITITFTLEQWRRNTSATTLNFDYQTYATNANILSSTGYTAYSSGNVTAPNTGTALGLDGNQAANQVAVSFTLNSVNWQDGQYLWLRWGNTEVAASSGVGIDNFTLTAVPEPGSVLLVLIGLGGILSRKLARRPSSIFTKRLLAS